MWCVIPQLNIVDKFGPLIYGFWAIFIRDDLFLILFIVPCDIKFSRLRNFNKPDSQRYLTAIIYTKMQRALQWYKYRREEKMQNPTCQGFLSYFSSSWISIKRLNGFNESSSQLFKTLGKTFTHYTKTLSKDFGMAHTSYRECEVNRIFCSR